MGVDRGAALPDADLHAARLLLHRHFADRDGRPDWVSAVVRLLEQRGLPGQRVLARLTGLGEVERYGLSHGPDRETCHYRGRGVPLEYAEVVARVGPTEIPDGRGGRTTGLRASVAVGSHEWTHTEAVTPTLVEARRYFGQDMSDLRSRARSRTQAAYVEVLRTTLGPLVLPARPEVRELLTAGRFVRIALDLDPAVRDYPWECAGHPFDRAAMIVDDERLSLTRAVAGGPPAPTSVLPEAVEFVLLSDDRGLREGAVRIREEIAASCPTGVARTAVGAAEFRQRALTAPKPGGVLHLMRHAEEDTALDDELVAAVVDRAPALVVLSQCFSGDHEPDAESHGALLCRAGVPLVVAASRKTTVDAQVAFAQRFYARLTGHGVPELAVQSARLAIGHDPAQRLQIMLYRG